MPPPLEQVPDLKTVLLRLLEEVRAILGDQFTGLYLHGSLALGDFDPQRSDVDFVVVTSGELPAQTVAALAAMHEQLAESESKWGHELEGAYIPEHALRRYDPANATFPHIERGGRMHVKQLHSGWLIQCHTLRRCGVALAGPPPHTLLEPISAATLRQAVLDLLWWWDLQLEDMSRVARSYYQAYAILTMCRILYTMRNGAIVSKPVAARWAQATLSPRWSALIERALTWQPEEELATLQEALAFIRYTLRRVRREAAQTAA